MQNYIKLIREKRELTQDALADMIGTNAGQIHKLESGLRRLSDVWIEKLCKAMKCTPAELFGAVMPRRIPVLGDVPGGDLALVIANPPETYIQYSSNRPNLGALRVKGNSMSRIAPDGVYVVIDFDATNPDSLNNQPVIFTIENEMTGEYECSFKIYKRNPDRFEPFSIEAGYDAIFPGNRKWKIYGRVCGTMGVVGYDNDEVKLLPAIEGEFISVDDA